MPEGPEIKRIADAMTRAVGGQIAQKVEFDSKRFKRYEDELEGKKIVSITPRGKAMLVDFEGGVHVYAHLQLYGRWYFEKDGKRPKRAVKFAVHGPEWSAYLCSTNNIAVLETPDLAEHKYLSNLGPDALDENVTVEDVIALLRSDDWKKKPVGKLLQEQSFIAGVGNYLRSEILFVCGLRPQAVPARMDDDALEDFAQKILYITRRAYELEGVVTPDDYIAEQKAAGAKRDAYRFHVYKREGKPCIQCGGAIELSEYSSRRIFICPTCQPE